MGIRLEFSIIVSQNSVWCNAIHSDDTWRPVLFILGGNSAAVSKSIETHLRKWKLISQTNYSIRSNSSVCWWPGSRERKQFDWWPALPVLCWTDSPWKHVCVLPTNDVDKDEVTETGVSGPPHFVDGQKRGLYTYREKGESLDFCLNYIQTRFYLFSKWVIVTGWLVRTQVKDRELPERRELDPQAATTADDLIL